MHKLRSLSLAVVCANVIGCVNAPAQEQLPMHAITLPAPNTAESNPPRQQKGQAYQVGFGRSVPAAQQRIALHSLKWQRVEDGYATTLSIRSTGANSLRVGMKLNADVAGLTLQFPSIASSTAVSVKQLVGPEVYWSPVIEGDTAVIELHSKAVPPTGTILEIPIVSHLP